MGEKYSVHLIFIFFPNNIIHPSSHLLKKAWPWYLTETDQCFLCGSCSLTLCPTHSPLSNLRSSWLGRTLSSILMEKINTLIISFSISFSSISKLGHSLQSQLDFCPRSQLFCLLLEFGIFFQGEWELYFLDTFHFPFVSKVFHEADSDGVRYPVCLLASALGINTGRGRGRKLEKAEVKLQNKPTASASQSAGGAPEQDRPIRVFACWVKMTGPSIPTLISH